MNIKASGRSALIVAAGIWIASLAPMQAQETTPAQAAAQQPAQAQPNPLQQLFGVKPTPAAAAPEPAAAPGKPVALDQYRKRASRHSRRHRAARQQKTHRGSRTAAKEKPAPEVKTSDADTDDTSVAKSNPPDALPAAVTNAKAQLLDPHADAAAAAPSPDMPAPQQSASQLTLPGQDNAPPAEQHDANADANAHADANVVPADQLNDVDRTVANHPDPTPTLALASINPQTTGQAATSDDDGSSWAQASLVGKIFIAFGGLLTLASAVRMFMV